MFDDNMTKIFMSCFNKNFKPLPNTYSMKIDFIESKFGLRWINFYVKFHIKVSYKFANIHSNILSIYDDRWRCIKTVAYYYTRT